MSGSTAKGREFAEVLEAGESVQWSEHPGPSRGGPREFKGALVPGGIAGFIAMFIVGTQELPAFVPLLAFVVAGAAVTWVFYSAHHLPGTASYAVTNRRVLILDGGELRTFGPDEITHLKVVPHSDGTVDLFWGDDTPAPRQRHRASDTGGARAQFRINQRHFRRGFLGLLQAEPAQTLIRELRDVRQRDAAAAALGIPLADGDAAAHAGAAAGRAADSGGDSAAAAIASRTPEEGWRTLREPQTGFAMEVPPLWKVQAATLKTVKILGVPVGAPPKWSETLTPGWNQLKIETGVEHAVLAVNLNPDTMPADVTSVLKDRWAKVLNLKVAGSDGDVRVGRLHGFSVTHDLTGAGPQAGAGPVKVGIGKLEAELLQTQWWLRGPTHKVHAQMVTPTDAKDLRAALVRVVQTLRFDGD